ncbi:BQ2448_2579 [Microbotryum intermedium]|uniref:BQ2448_2579 protein n=1 Tax=Microbotryum intermedium TaxID=269621 RepID=A0A238F9Y2_9BASI|nr:BQ2448_2579 [Microbotryum intermedium]
MRHNEADSAVIAAQLSQQPPAMNGGGNNGGANGLMSSHSGIPTLKPQQLHSTPSSPRAATVQAPTSTHVLQLTPVQAEALASLGLSALITSPTTTTTKSSTSSSEPHTPQSPAFPPRAAEANPSPFTRVTVPTPAAIAASLGVGGALTAASRALAHEMELAYPTTPSSGAPSTPSTAPPTPYYFAPPVGNAASSSGVATHSLQTIARATPPPPPANSPMLASTTPTSNIVPPQPAHSAPPTRHHPYAHPAHPRPLHANPASVSSIPHYLSTSVAASPARDSPLSTPPMPSTSFSPAPPIPPPRVKSAPVHIASNNAELLPGEGQYPAEEGYGQAADVFSSALEQQHHHQQQQQQQQQQQRQQQAQAQFHAAQVVHAQAQAQADWEARRLQQNNLAAAMDSSAVVGDWEGDRGMTDATALSLGIEEAQQAQAQAQAHAQVQALAAPLQLARPTSSGQSTNPPLAMPTAMPTTSNGYYESPTAPPIAPAFSFPPPPTFQPGPNPHPPPNETVAAAIALLKNRLPILEAALTTSTSDLGNDEEEIWKGVASAYKELKRIMNARKGARREATAVQQSAAQNYAMDLESHPPTSTSVPPTDRPITAGTIFLNTHTPPLVHSQSSPEGLPTIATQRAAHALAQASNVQSMQRQQAAMQQQMQQMQQAVAQQQQQQAAQAHDAQVQAQAQAHAQAQAQAQACQAQAHMQAELHARAQQEVAEQQARAVADASTRREQQFQQEQYQQAVSVQQQQHHAAAVAAQAQHVLQAGQQHLQGFEAQTNAVAAQQQQDFVSAATAAASTQLPSATAAANGSVPSHAPMPMAPTMATITSMNSTQMHPMSPNTMQAKLYGRARTVSQPTLGAFATGSAPLSTYDTDYSMGAVMQMQMSLGSASANGGLHAQPSTHSPLPALYPDDIETSMLAGASSADAALDDMSSNHWRSNPTHAALTAAVTSVVAPTPAAQVSLHSPTSAGATPTISSRPARSRAASGSGYASASGSRSRAASGSGYQTLSETRSRAASSASSVFGPPYEIDDEDELEDEFEDAVVIKSNATSSLAQAYATVSPELRARMDPVFNEYLCDLCSNLEATDSKGEVIHQTLMAKKMERLDQSTDFRPFKFRIAAFTSAFSERLVAAGFVDVDIPTKRVRQYLWSQSCISRYNDDGKKAKSKGNHIWTIEAKKDPERRWVFRTFERCIKGNAPQVAFIGLPWTWTPRVWDPQCSISPALVTFSSPSLPPWLHWHDHLLTGEAPESAHGQTFEIEAIAYIHGATDPGKPNEISSKVSILVASPSERKDVLSLSMSSDHDVSAPVSQAASPVISTRGTFFPPHMQQVSSTEGDGRAGLQQHQYQADASRSHLLPSPMGGHPMNQGQPESPSSTLAQQQQQQHQQQEQEVAHNRQQQQLLLKQQMYAQAACQVQLDSDLNMVASSDDAAMDPDSAALHRHYAAVGVQSIAASSTSFDQQIQSQTEAALSFAPAAELVANAALQQAQGDGLTPKSYSNVLLTGHPEVGMASQIDVGLRNIALRDRQSFDIGEPIL